MGVVFAIVMIGMLSSAQASPADAGTQAETNQSVPAKENAPADLLAIP
jgi:hypothetical protein